MCVDLSNAFNRLDHSKLVTILFDMGTPVCALRLLCNYLENRRMQLHLNGQTSDIFELWGGGPQGGLLTVILFNVYANWLTDICQPNVPWENRFSKENVPVSVPRCRKQQSRDCPSAFLPPYEHLGSHQCPYVPACVHSNSHPNSNHMLPSADNQSVPCRAVSESGPALGGFNGVEEDSVVTSGQDDDSYTVPASSSVSSCSHHPTCDNPCLPESCSQFCLPVLDYNGLCHCSHQEQIPHVPQLPPIPSNSYPLCRNEMLRLLYIDDATCCEVLDLDKLLVPLIETSGPHGKMASCGLAIPGQWLGLEHKLKEITENANALGMQVNSKKTKLIIFNNAITKLAVPCVSAEPGHPLLCVDELRLLGLVFDHKMTLWPMINDLVRRASAKIWMLLRLREAGAESSVLLTNYYTRIRSILEYGAPVWGCCINGLQSKVLEDCQAKAL